LSFIPWQVERLTFAVSLVVAGLRVFQAAVRSRRVVAGLRVFQAAVRSRRVVARLRVFQAAVRSRRVVARLRVFQPAVRSRRVVALRLHLILAVLVVAVPPLSARGALQHVLDLPEVTRLASLTF